MACQFIHSYSLSFKDSGHFCHFSLWVTAMAKGLYLEIRLRIRKLCVVAQYLVEKELVEFSGVQMFGSQNLLDTPMVVRFSSNPWKMRVSFMAVCCPHHNARRRSCCPSLNAALIISFSFLMCY